MRVECLDLPDAAIHYEVRGAGPPRLLHAAPMDARAFEQLEPDVFDMMFGTPPTAQELDDERYGVERMQLPTTVWQPDVDALVDGSVTVIPAVGSQSHGQLCDRTTRALAAQLGREVVEMPGDHTGFVDQPGAVAAELRRLLASHDLEE